MIGALAGDMIGSVYEFAPIKKVDFPLFQAESSYTDDTVLTVATADSLLSGKSYAAAFKQWGRKYPTAGYGTNFYQWLMSRCSVAYGSWGNGAAMRVSPIGWAFPSLEKTLEEAGKSALVTHNHPEGIKGAQAVAGAVWLARNKKSKSEIRSWIENEIAYPLPESVAAMRPDYSFNVSCQNSVPQAISCFLEAQDTEEAIRLAVSLGGDADTQACIAGAIGEAYWGISQKLTQDVLERLPKDIREVTENFRNRFLSGK